MSWMLWAGHCRGGLISRQEAHLEQSGRLSTNQIRKFHGRSKQMKDLLIHLTSQLSPLSHFKVISLTESSVFRSVTSTQTSRHKFNSYYLLFPAIYLSAIGLI